MFDMGASAEILVKEKLSDRCKNNFYGLMLAAVMGA
jgi:hypothetical protein